MVNHIPKYETLVILAERDSHDLATELKRFSCTRLSVHGTPENLGAISNYPGIVDVSLRGCSLPTLDPLQGLINLRKLSVSFGPLKSLDLSFCRSNLEVLALSRLRRLKDLSSLPAMPKLEHLVISHMHSFVPPDFRRFPNLRQLSIWNTDWQTLTWLSHLPSLEILHISQIKVADNDWKPLLQLSHLRHLHGVQSAFRSAARDEFSRLRPEVSTDKGLPVDLEKYPDMKEFMEDLRRGKGN